MLQSILVKPAGPDCNMACEYCFYRKKVNLYPEETAHRMSEEVLEELIHQAMSQAEELVTFIWQGGEPTLMGLDFYRRVIRFQKKYGRNKLISNELQTNGLLLNERWIPFLRKYNFFVGLSIDGPEHIHHHFRRMEDGRSTWHKVIDKVQMLLDGGVITYALAVVNSYSAQFAEEIYDFFKEQGLNDMQFIPCVEPDPANPERPAPFSVSSTAYGLFLCKIFDSWWMDFQDGQPKTSIRLFDSLLYRYLRREAPECSLLHTCGNYLVVGHNGDVYPCDFYVEPEWKLGNIKNDQLIHLLNSEKQRIFGEMKAELAPMCRACEYLQFCTGGCTRYRWPQDQAKALHHLCFALRELFIHADPRFHWLAEQVKRGKASP